MCWQWVGPKLHSLLSTHCLIGACFLTTESDKRMRLLTRLYGNVNVHGPLQGFTCFWPKIWGGGGGGGGDKRDILD